MKLSTATLALMSPLSVKRVVTVSDRTTALQSQETID